jgi:hypothetical protein
MGIGRYSFFSPNVHCTIRVWLDPAQGWARLLPNHVNAVFDSVRGLGLQLEAGKGRSGRSSRYSFFSPNVYRTIKVWLDPLKP